MNRKIVQTTSLEAAREATDVDTQTSCVRRHVARGFPWCNRGLDRSGRGFAAYHALCPPDQLGAHRDRLQLQRPERHRGKIRNCTRQTAPADESYLCLAWLRGRMWPLRLHHKNHTRGNRTVRSRRPTVLQLKPLSFLERPDERERLELSSCGSWTCLLRVGLWSAVGGRYIERSECRSAALENRTTPKISQMVIFGFLRARTAATRLTSPNVKPPVP